LTPWSVAAPTDLTVTATSPSSAHLHWVDNATTESKYQIFGYNPNQFELDLAAHSTDADVFNLQAGLYACFNVVVSDPYGNTASTPGCVFMPPSVPPAPPTNPNTQVAPDPLGQGDDITFGWQLPPGRILGLRVARSDGVTWQMVAEADQYQEVVPYSYEQPVQYCYRVQAYNEAGDSPWTPWACAQTIPLPLEPSNIQLTATPTSVTMTWTDNSVIASGYYVGNGLTGPVDQLNGITGVVAEVPPSATSYTFTGLTPGKFYALWVDTNATGSHNGQVKTIRTPLA
jgi:hypothetical protein